MNPHPWLRIAPLALAALAALFLAPALASANPTLGFREDFPGTSIGTWGGGGASGLLLDNPGTGGADADGFLRLVLEAPGKFGARSLGAEYAGDWIAAGVQVVRFSLHNLGSDDGHEIHFCIGNTDNFWQYDAGFQPTDQWTAFSVDVTSSQGFTQIIGTGTFEDALRHVDRILIRHDRPPFVQVPEDTQGDLGIDRIRLLDATTRTRPTTWSLVKSLYR